MTTLITNAIILNEGKHQKGSLLIENDLIKSVFFNKIPEHITANNVIDAKGQTLLPGVIDDQVHFREPGLTHKGNIHSESRAAVAGGITSYMEMPNTLPQAVTQEELQRKYDIAAESSIANYSFHMGATNENLEEVLKTDKKNVCGVKVFMGSSTGNMLVDNPETLTEIFSNCELIISSHCEDEATVKGNTQAYKEKYGKDMPFKYHPEIRSAEACYKSSSKAAELAHKTGARLHILHLSSAKELEIFSNKLPLEEKKVTGEACIHHMWFTDKDYDKKGAFIKWNPAVKYEEDRDAIREAVNNNTIDVVATDHAPHTFEEKSNDYFHAPSGGPLVQHALPAMLEMYHQGVFTLEKIVEKMCHHPAILFEVEKRGFIREGYKADLVLVDLNEEWKVTESNILYKCGWSPFTGDKFRSKVKATFVNGKMVYDGDKIIEAGFGERLTFDR